MPAIKKYFSNQKKNRRQNWLLMWLFVCFPWQVWALQEAPEPLTFDDNPLTEPVEVPDWFKLSFLDLEESLNEAKQAGKRGMILYFHRQDCAYCDAQIRLNWGSDDIKKYTQEHFDVITIDVRGQRTVTNFDGKTYSEKDFATLLKTDFTPTQLFYNTQGRMVLRLPGFRQPYQYRAALEFVADGHYRRETYARYMERAEAALSFGQDDMNDHDAFLPPPYNLDRRSKTTSIPLVVFFEHPRCHACDVLHAGPLSNEEISAYLNNLVAVQLDIHSDMPVTTPGGKKTTARQWARELELNFAPTLIFFDTKGNEIIRIDSVVRLYRLNNVLDYVSSKAYQNYPTFQIWQQNILRQP